ncbi:MAG: DUF4411 family protein [Algoriphagus sp.]|jgi:hypothetical protein|nr:DUF4411 family protein [Algoriphagus sp.]MDO8966357.1 DUF4411 family protein [Algoriphagus sp.]MDP3202304.1 DUF4411 family protein [Algoriphagus sp.]
MRVLIDTSSLLSLVRNYLPLDKSGFLFEEIRNKISTGEFILLDAVYEEIKYQSKGIILKKLDYLSDKGFLKEYKIIVKTDELLPLAPGKFMNMLGNQFAIQGQLKRLNEAEFEVKKKEFMESADAKLILYCQHLIMDHPDEETYLVTEETAAANDLKLFKKIPAICEILGIPVITLPELLLKKYPNINLGFG